MWNVRHFKIILMDKQTGEFTYILSAMEDYFDA